MAEANAPALREVAARLHEAIERGLWTPRSNSARMRVAEWATSEAEVMGAGS
jgi:cobaltochelatase CobN